MAHVKTVKSRNRGLRFKDVLKLFANFNLSVSLFLSSPIFLNFETPFAIEQTKKINDNL